MITILLPPIWRKAGQEPRSRLEPLANDAIVAAHKAHEICGTWHHGNSSP